MFISTDQKSLLTAVDSARKAADARSYVQCLHGLMLEADGSTLTVSGTDLEVWVSSSVDVDRVDYVDSTGTFLVSSARQMSDALKSFGPGPIVLRTEGDTLEIVRDGAVSRIALLSVEDYPVRPAVGELEGTVTVGAVELAEIVARVVVFASKDQARPVLTACRLECSADRVQAIATDSYRLGFDWQPAETSGEFAFLVPARVLTMAAREAKRQKCAATFTVGLERAEVVVGATVIRARLVQGQYPDWQRLMPDAFTGTVDFRAADAIAAATRAGKLNDKRPIRLEIAPAGGTAYDGFAVTTWNAQGEEDSRASVPVVTSTADDAVTIGCNPGFFADACKAIGTDVVVVDYINPLRPFIVHNCKADSGVLQMPIRLDG